MKCPNLNKIFWAFSVSEFISIIFIIVIFAHKFEILIVFFFSGILTN